MISSVELTNFKCFNHVILDLRKSDGSPKDMVFIYGENGVGNTHLIDAFEFLKNTFQTMNFQSMAQDITNHLSNMSDDEKSKIPAGLLEQLLKDNFVSLQKLALANRQIGNSGQLKIKFGTFLSPAVNGYYELVFNEQGEVIEETLYGPLNQRKGICFQLTKDKVFLSKSVFSAVFISDIEAQIGKFWGKHTLGALLNYEVHTKNKEYIGKSIDANVLALLNDLASVSLLNRGGILDRMSFTVSEFPIPGNLERGALPLDQKENLLHWEQSINDIFVGLYADLDKVYYRFTENRDSIEYELYFKKQIGGHLIDIPITAESAGTKRLLQMVPLLLSMTSGGVVCIDEVDTSIHDLLIERVLTGIRIDMKGQCIATTHNTHLMQQLSPHDVYIITSDENGDRSIRCVSDYAMRTQRNNNMQKKYLGGAYDGIPYSSFVDFEQITDELRGCYVRERGE